MHYARQRCTISGASAIPLGLCPVAKGRELGNGNSRSFPTPEKSRESGIPGKWELPKKPSGAHAKSSFSGTPEKQLENFQEKSTFSREKSTFPRQILKKSTKVFKNGCSFPVGNSRRNKSGVGTGIPDPKNVGIGIHIQGTQP